MTVQDFILSVVVGVLTGLAASTLWLFIIYRFKPKIDIAERICVTSKDEKYIIIVKNRSRRAALNVKAELRLMIPMGEFNNTKPITLKRGELLQLSGRPSKLMQLLRRIFHRRQEKKGTPGAFRFVIQDNLDSLEKKYPNSYLAFRLFATHEVTQFGKVFKRNYSWDKTKGKKCEAPTEEEGEEVVENIGQVAGEK